MHDGWRAAAVKACRRTYQATGEERLYHPPQEIPEIFMLLEAYSQGVSGSIDIMTIDRTHIAGVEHVKDTANGHLLRCLERVTSNQWTTIIVTSSTPAMYPHEDSGVIHIECATHDRPMTIPEWTLFPQRRKS